MASRAEKQTEVATEAEAFRQAKELAGSPEFLIRADGIDGMLKLVQSAGSQVRQWAHLFLMENYRGYRAMRANGETAGAASPTPNRLQG